MGALKENNPNIEWRFHADDCPGPEFLCGVDQSTEILCALEATLLGRASEKYEALPQADTSGAWSGISRNLKKVRGLYQCKQHRQAVHDLVGAHCKRTPCKSICYPGSFPQC